MEVVVDGIIFQLQSRGGISRLYSEILPRLCALDESLNLTFLLIGGCEETLPSHPRLSYRRLPEPGRFLRPSRFWGPFFASARAITCSLSAAGTRRKIWHSTYYTSPAWWGGPRVVTVPDMIVEVFPELYDKPANAQFVELKRHCILEADVVICISETTRKDVERICGVDASKLVVVPLACSDAFLEPSTASLDSVRLPQKPYLLYVGDRIHYKNFGTLIRAYSVWQSRGEVDIVVAGKPWSAAESRQLEALGIAGQVHVLGDVSDRAMAGLYRAAAAFAYPSLYEGFGIPLLEAMASGCPIVASRIPSTMEVAGDCPIYFDPTSVDGLVAAFDQALAEGRDSKRTRDGLKRVGGFSWETTASQTLELYRALCQ